MRDRLSSLASDRVPEVAIALALGYALVTLFEHVVRVPVAVLAQNFGNEIAGEDADIDIPLDLFSAPYYLNFRVGDVYIAYGPALSAAFVIGLVGLVAWIVVRRRDRVLGECPFCASRIPYESTHCAYCGSGVEQGEAA
jgi:hypothetical protein